MSKLPSSGLLNLSKLKEDVKDVARLQNYRFLEGCRLVNETTENNFKEIKLTPKLIKNLISRLSKCDEMSDELEEELDNVQANIINHAVAHIDEAMDELTKEEYEGLVGPFEIIAFFMVFLTKMVASLDKKDLHQYVAQDSSISNAEDAYKATVLGILETMFQLMMMSKSLDDNPVFQELLVN